jgi:hypothetical protein
MTPTLRHPGVVVAFAAALVAAEAAVVPAGAAQRGSQKGAKAAATTESLALEDFQTRVKAYLELRKALAEKLEPLKPTADAAELATRQEALAEALKVARKDARAGDVIPAPVADRIRTIVRDDLKSRTAAAGNAPFGEIPTNVRVSVNRTFPKGAALPTVPPLLLGRLPPLPDNLQYRFANRDVVLLDGDTQLIVDHVTHVLPRH